MPKKIKFIHSADLHLDSPFMGMSTLPDALYQELKRSTFVALDNLVSVAIREEVDFVLIVGDLFDQSIKSIYAEMQFLLACRRLNNANIPVYLSYGNHDYIGSNSRMLDYPSNLHIFESDQVESKIFHKDGVPLVGIHGFSYHRRAVLDNMTAGYLPVDNLPYQIGMLHGSLGQSEEHDNYAPFQLGDLQKSDMNYWALGHIHKRAILSNEPAVVYPGNTQGRSSKELGKKGCYIVELDQMETTLTFQPLHHVEFEKITIDVNDCEQLDQLYQMITEQLLQFKEQRTILFITLTNISGKLIHSYYNGEIGELIGLINEEYQEQASWNWIQELHVKEPINSNGASLEYRDPFMTELTASFEKIHWQDMIKDLSQHSQAKRYLPEFTEEEKQELMKKAKELALYQLIGMGQDENN